MFAFGGRKFYNPVLNQFVFRSTIGELVLYRNIKLVIEYDGTDYNGWQEQEDKPTIQHCLKTCIQKLTGETVIVYGAGRTDAGVHANGQVANFHTSSTVPSHAFAKALNSLLPVDIAVRESGQVADDFHAQFCAKSKAYSYRIICRPTRPAIEQRYAFWVWDKLDVESMYKGSRHLLGTHDFSSFEAANSPRKSSVRTVNCIDIVQESCYIKFLIEADGFLYHMVRNIVGTLLAVGRKRRDEQEIKTILQSRQRKWAGPTAPAHGLFLEYVKY